MVSRGELTLDAPHQRFHQSFLAAAREFEVEGSSAYTANSGLTVVELTEPEAFSAYVDSLLAFESPEVALPDGLVPMTERWLIVDGVFVGRINLRHRLNDPLLNWVGHIGYAVRPTARQRGYATAALTAMLPVAAALGIEQALLTCDEDNLVSRRIIEAFGGVYEDTRQTKRRYWVAT